MDGDSAGIWTERQGLKRGGALRRIQHVLGVVVPSWLAFSSAFGDRRILHFECTLKVETVFPSSPDHVFHILGGGVQAQPLGVMMWRGGGIGRLDHPEPKMVIGPCGGGQRQLSE